MTVISPERFSYDDETFQLTVDIDGLVTEDAQCMRRHGPGGDMNDRRQQLPGHLVEVRDHQQQALRGCECRGERPALEGSVDGAGCAALALHFDNLRDHSPYVLDAGLRPRVCELTHRRRGRDRIDRDHLAQLVGHTGGGFVSINGDEDGLVSSHWALLVDLRRSWD